MVRGLALIVVAAVVIADSVSAQSRFGSAPVTPRTGSRSQPQAAPPPPLPTETTRRSGQPPAAPPTTTSSGVSQLPPLHGVAQLPPPVVNAQPRDLFLAGRRTYSPRLNRGFGSSLGYVTGGYVSGDYYASPADDRRADTSAPVEVGYLRLNVQPYTAQVFVDGFYVSSVDAFTGGGGARALPAGPHRIEIRADGYETATFDVRIDPNETITYRRELGKSEEPKQARTVAPAIPKTFYVIPKCYAGDKKPSAEKLPAGCQALNVRTIPPVVYRAR